ncbi:MAG TPA: hypothetical protein EYN07_09050 [Flavobacteriaceae bacterium]|jgi:hypothetical protein|nr:hypothetical protein [Flavobacteriaceae bacterium]MAM28940.1 hypothetical protein [Flavobacteriaceae bacterium]MAY53980.1 hypothetical protein [Flavobacteriaceae bacterium]HBR55042.1 hypothetical protein [Flavobacteriaceae bacterium]HIB47898.1 hypothetical protein [Flavobacteriaceae bacterium]|tara:strand:- start:1238 stop:1885 length:648 start_codon:yes stop_codon:yes gene_type:complete
MKFLLSILILLTVQVPIFAQLDRNTPNSVKIEATDITSEDPKGITLPASKKPSLTPRDTPNKYANLGKETPEEFDMTKGDGLKTYNSGSTPKAFVKDKAADDGVGNDQFLGEIRVGAVYVNIAYRDHEFVDGDRIRIFLNGDVVRSDVSLNGSFDGFNVPLQKGPNKIVFQALNQGSSGPNTAELQVYDDKGRIVSAKEWILLTGKKATIIVIQE